jgi:cytochrome c
MWLGKTPMTQWGLLVYPMDQKNVKLAISYIYCFLHDFLEMFVKFTLALTAACLVFATPAFANLDMAKKNACMACHAVDKKLVGPAFQEVAKKYGSQKDAEAQLTKSIKAGGSGKWGPIPMPAQAALSDADAKTLAAWVLAGAK